MIADRIKMLRESKKMSQSELARKLGITRSSVNAWEQGFSTPSTSYLVELSKILNVSTDYILGLSMESYIDVAGLDVEEVNMIITLVEHFRKGKNTSK